MTPGAIIFVILAIGATGGLTMLVLAGFGVVFPRWFGAAHGLLNLSGTGLLFAANLFEGDAVAAARWWALGILVAAMAGGLMFFRAVFPLRVPFWATAIHGALATSGLCVLAPTTGLFN